jgi:DNA-directed RNA polymerase specialized sigma24 family protein
VSIASLRSPTLSIIPLPSGAAKNVRDIRVAQSADLHWLVLCVARKDRAAFVVLYDLMSPALLADVRSRITEPTAAAITAATFVEVWSLARYHTSPDTDVYAWMTDIALRRLADRRPTERDDPLNDSPTGPAAPRRQMWWAAVAASHDRQAHIALASLLHRRPPEAVGYRNHGRSV